MKKMLGLVLALVLLLGGVVNTQAITWAEPVSATDAGAPITVEVIKLEIKQGITGAAYYTTLEDGAAYPYSTVYYAIKLVLPSYAAVNAYYKTTELSVGSKLSVSLTYTNLSGLNKQSVNVYLSAQTQTLWYNGTFKAFEESWVPSITNNCGCGDAHVLSATTAGSGTVKVQACLGYAGALSAVRLGNAYTVEKKTYYGARPCVNCALVDLKGFIVNSDCAANGVFFAVDKNDKVIDVYVFANCDAAAQDVYAGGMSKSTTKLYRWAMTEPIRWCSEDVCVRPTFTLTELNNNQPFRRDGRFVNSETLVDPALFLQYCEQFRVNANLRDWNLIYEKNSDGEYAPWSSLTSNYYRLGISDGNTETVVTDEKYYKYLETPATILNYGNIYSKQAAESGSHLFRMLAADRVDCDDSAKGFLRSANTVFELLEFTYADVAAGTIYMTEGKFLTNFGLYISVCGSASWNEYTASITTAPVAEVPATGSGCVSFATLCLAGAVIAFSLKRRRDAR